MCGRNRGCRWLTRAPHPDRMGGIGFLSRVTNAFSPLLFAQGALLAGALADDAFQGAVLADPVGGCRGRRGGGIRHPWALTGFVAPLAAAKRTAPREYGHLARRYVGEFDDKWLRGGASRDEPLIGSADIQSLADLGNSFEVVRGMRHPADHQGYRVPACRYDTAADRAAAAYNAFTGELLKAILEDRVCGGRES